MDRWAPYPHVCTPTHASVPPCIVRAIRTHRSATLSTSLPPHPPKAIEFERKTPGASTTFVHLNAYKTEELGECFERNAEGMLKNMAIHELAVLATYYGQP